METVKALWWLWLSGFVVLAGAAIVWQLINMRNMMNQRGSGNMGSIFTRSIPVFILMLLAGVCGLLLTASFGIQIIDYAKH